MLVPDYIRLLKKTNAPLKTPFPKEAMDELYPVLIQSNPVLIARLHYDNAMQLFQKDPSTYPLMGERRFFHTIACEFLKKCPHMLATIPTSLLLCKKFLAKLKYQPIWADIKAIPDNWDKAGWEPQDYAKLKKVLADIQ